MPNSNPSQLKAADLRRSHLQRRPRLSSSSSSSFKRPRLKIYNFRTINTHCSGQESKHPIPNHFQIKSIGLLVFGAGKMKASIKFREDQKPLLRAKVPLSILGLPFQSGVVSGESKELSLNLGTFFDSGPSLKLAYRPNDSLNPFTLVFKTGIGHFGSPISSPMTMSAEFNLIGNQNPSFFVHFKPKFGDFCIKKSQSSEFVKTVKAKASGAVSDDDGSIEVVESPAVKSGLFSDEKIRAFQSESSAARLICGLLRGTEASAKTTFPVLNRAVVNLRWGFRFPAEERRSGPAAGISIDKLPLLVMNKISVEHVADDPSKDSSKVRHHAALNSPYVDDVAKTCLAVKHQLEVIQAENGVLRKAVDDLRSQLPVGKLPLCAAAEGSESGKYREGERGDRRSNGNKKSSALDGPGGRGSEGNLNNELKAGKMATAGA